ncbi:MAG: sugar ABC transporter permease [Anaerolineae bacterium]|nr:sugar ABC transporter permease [Anaerolineae bacterium]
MAQGIRFDKPLAIKAAPRKKVGLGLKIEPYLFLLPALTIYAIFSLGPVIGTLVLSFFKWKLFAPTGEFFGTRYYGFVLNDPRFWNAFGHNLILLAAAVTIPIGIGLLLAVMIGELTRGRTVYRFLFFLPVVFSGVVVAYVWRWIYNPYNGLLNQILNSIGLGSLAQSWLGDTDIALFSVIIVYTWSSFGYSMVIFLAGLQGIDPDLYDAAAVDGAGFWRKLRHITIPSLRDVFTFALNLKIIGALAIIDIVFVLTGGGPNYATDVVGVYVYRMIGNVEMGRATAAAALNGIIIVLLVGAFTRWRERNND